MSAAFTPGPWTHGFDGHGGLVIEADDCDGLQIGFVSRGHEGNARLIAIAPPMHAALAQIARMQMDGEGGFVLENDDAVDGLHSCIGLAREALAGA